MLIAIAAVWFVNQVNETNQKVELKEIQIKDTQAELRQLELNYDNLNKKLESTSGDKEELENERRKLRKQLEEAQKALQAKKAAKERLAVSNSGNVAHAASGPSSVQPTGDCASWVRAAGVKDVSNALDLISRESGCRVDADNPTSDAYGIPQSLPGSKMASAGADWMTNPVTQIRWMDGYVKARYGSWANANAFQRSNNWY